MSVRSFNWVLEFVMRVWTNCLQSILRITFCTSLLHFVSAAGAAIDPAADWAARTAGGNVMEAQNFSGFTSSQQLRDWEIVSNPNRMSLVTEHALSGKTVRLTTLPGDADVSHGFQSTLDGVPTGVRTPRVYKRFYFQFILWADDYFNWPFRSTATNAPKLAIIDRSPINPPLGIMHSPSSNPGEVVVDNQNTYGFIHVYRRMTSNNAFQEFVRSQASSVNPWNFSWHPSVDNGGPTGSQNEYEQRYGPFWQGMSGTSQSAGQRLTDQFGAQYPDPDAAAGSVAWNRGGYTVIEIFLDYDADRAQVWAAHYGETPKLLIDSNDDDRGAAFFNQRGDGIQGWDGYHLTTFRTKGVAEPGVRPEMYVDYAEVIVSSAPIPFPGQILVPLPGSLDPSGSGDTIAPRAPGNLIVQ